MHGDRLNIAGERVLVRLTPPPLQGGGVFNVTNPLLGDILDEQKSLVCRLTFVPVGLTPRGHIHRPT